MKLLICPNDGATLANGVCPLCAFYSFGDRHVDFVRHPLTTAPWVDSIDERTARGRAKRVLRARASGYVNCVGDRSRLEVYQTIMTMLGTARMSVLDQAVLLDFDPEDSKTYSLLAEATIAAQTDAGAFWRANRGTWAHTITEHVDLGQPITDELYEEAERYRVDADELAVIWSEFIERSGVRIQAVECRVVNDTFNAAGTLDRIVRLTRPMRFNNGIVLTPSEQRLVGDVKSSQLRLANGEPGYWDDYTAQIYLYATAAPYAMWIDGLDRRQEHRAAWPWDIDDEHGLIAHINLEGKRPVCSWWHADLAAGRDLTLLAWGSRQFARRSGLFAAAVAS